MKKTFLALALICTSAPLALAQAAFTGTYTFGGVGLTNTNSFPYNGTDIANLTEGSFLKVGITTASSATNFRGSNWALDTTPGALTGSVDLSKYLEFSLTAASGFTFDMTSFTFGVGRSGTGTRSFQWRSSLDSYGSIISGYTTVNTNLNQTLGAGILTYTADVTTGATGNVLNLSNATYQGLTSITFRLYGYNSEQSGGTGGLEGPFTFSGSLLNTNPVTGGTYWAADPAGGGSGTWTSAGTTWATNTGGAGAGQTQSSATLIFADTAGTVTVSGGVTVSNGMTFQTTGYDVQGSTITLAGTSAANNAVTTDAGVTTTVSSELAGTTGMTKAGAGTLILSGSNSFTGNAVISGGTLQITNDAVLGNVANDLANNGTLRTTTSVALDVGRDISGSGTYDIANGTTLTVNGNINNTTTTLANTGTLDLQGVTTRSLGSVTLNAAGTINAVGAINASGLTAPGLSSGTATINPDIVFTSGDKLLNVAAGGTVDLNGSLSNGGGTGRIIKTGAGTLVLSANNMGGVRIGTNAATSVDGGTVILNSSTIGTQAQAIQLNNGTLSAATNLVFTNGISIGGQTNGVAILSGNNMEFQGQSAFFRNTGTTGPAVLDVNNTTTFSGGFNFVTGAGTGTGVTIGGSGEVIISGNSSALVDTITLTDTVKLTLNNNIGGNLTVGPANTLAGNGTMGGSLSLLSGAKLVFSLTEALIVNGPSVTFGGFSIGDLIGLDNTVPNGIYTIIDGLATINTNNLINFGAENAYDLGSGKSAYFTVGSLEVNVVPEPSTYALLSLAAAGLGAHLIRRRRR